jgi:hypothetical protein
MKEMPDEVCEHQKNYPAENERADCEEANIEKNKLEKSECVREKE